MTKIGHPTTAANREIPLRGHGVLCSRINIINFWLVGFLVLDWFESISEPPTTKTYTYENIAMFIMNY